MKPYRILHSGHVLATGLLASLLSSGLAGAATTLIDADTNNGSFEYVNGVNNPSYTTKVDQWDGDSAGEIDDWTWWSGNSNDSGSQVWTPAPAPPAGPTGVRFGFIQPGSGVYNLTTYTAQVGDTFTLSWDHVGTRNVPHTVSLVYFDGTNVLAIPGTDIAATASQLAYGGTFTLAADSPAISYPIGIGVTNSTINQWGEIDNFVLSVESVPEPSAALLGGLGLLALFRRRKA